MSKVKNASKEEFESVAGFETLVAGSYNGTISGIADDVSEEHGLPQKVITLKDAKTGQTIRHWMNRVGLAKNADGSYAVDDNGNLIEDPENTKKCNVMIGQLANKAGIETGAKFGWADLMGREIGFVVENHTYNGKASVRVKAFVNAEKMASRLAALETADYETAE